jgi:alkylation response protein AidB-like acyl-CoA dehydrogenase
MSVVKKPLSTDKGDFYHINAILSEEDQDLLFRVRTFMEDEVAPIINQYWIREEFPHQIIPGLAALNIAGLAYHGYACPGKSTLLDGMMAREMARVDSSIATFMGVHSGLAMGSIYLCGSEEQKQQWLPSMRRFEKIGAFGLTEPEVGSGASGGLMTIARREGNTWILNGQKKWIGNATGIMCDEHASLAKAFCTVRMRETVGYARELLAGNGILLDHHVGRFVADAEAIYSYEGTREMNSLIVGRAITGFSAFV